MNTLLNEYEGAVQILSEQLSEGVSYLEKYSDQSDTFEQIKKEEEQINCIRKEFASKQDSNCFLNRFYPDFNSKRIHLFLTTLYTLSSRFNNCTRPPSFRENWIKINHLIEITVSIRSIIPLMKKWGNLQNELSFDRLRFHLHHIGKHTVSKFMRYHPLYNLYHRSELIDGRIMRSQRGLTLKIRHQIRPHNTNLYHQMLPTNPIILIAQSAYGAIVGFAQINVLPLAQQGLINRQFKFLKFSKKRKHLQNLQLNDIIFSAKVQISAELSPICPEMQSLAQFTNQKSKQNLNSSSVSPRRISRSAGKRGGRDKSKRKYLKGMCMVDGIIRLSVFEGREYKFEVDRLNPTASMQLIYKKAMNIGKKKIQLVKIGSNYYLKMLLIRQCQNKPGTLQFCFNNSDYQVYIISNTLLQIVEFTDEQNSHPQDKTDHLHFTQQIIHLGHGENVFAKDNNRIKKSLGWQQLYEGLLTSVYIKSRLQGCQIYCNKPFIIAEIVHKQEGYLITYYYLDQPIRKKVEKTLVFYIHQTGKSTETHAFNCLIKQRIFDRQTLFRQLVIPKNQIFFILNMKMITDQNYQYQIRAADQSIAIINGQNFKFQYISNENLEIQLLKPITNFMETDIIFYDNRGKSFFLRLILKTNSNQPNKIAP